LLDRLAVAEQSFQKQEFLAPALRGSALQVRMAGIVCQFRIDRGFEGWGVFCPADVKTARFIRPATLAERQRYLGLLPDRRLILCARVRRHWLAWPAERGDGRYGPPTVVNVHLLEEVELFDTVAARFDGARHWFERIDERSDPALAAYLRSTLAAEVAPDKVLRPGLTAEARTAYAVAHALLLQARRDPTEDRLRCALAHAGAELQSYLLRDEALRIEFTVDGQRHVSLIGTADLSVQLAGICLSGEDRKFDLTSLVGVLREAGADEVVRIGAEGLPAEQYWQVHPRR
jgi:hypothetical protein